MSDARRRRNTSRDAPYSDPEYSDGDDGDDDGGYDGDDLASWPPVRAFSVRAFSVRGMRANKSKLFWACIVWPLVSIVLAATETAYRKNSPDSALRPSNLLWSVAHRLESAFRWIGWHVALVVSHIWEYARDMARDFFALLDPFINIIMSPIYLVLGCLDYVKAFCHFVYDRVFVVTVSTGLYILAAVVIASLIAVGYRKWKQSRRRRQ